MHYKTARLQGVTFVYIPFYSKEGICIVNGISFYHAVRKLYASAIYNLIIDGKKTIEYL